MAKKRAGREKATKVPQKLTIAEAARRRDVTPQTVYYWIRGGYLTVDEETFPFTVRRVDLDRMKRPRSGRPRKAAKR